MRQNRKSLKCIRKAAALWSGGKDSCFACYQAMTEHNFEIACLLNFISPQGRSLSHHISAQLLSDQMKLTAIPYLQVPTSSKDYEQNFRKVLTQLNLQGIEQIVFGDIFLGEHRNWIEKICQQLKLKALFPLWGKNTDQIAEEFIQAKFEAIIVAVDQDKLDFSYLGRTFQREVLEELVSKNIDPCGEWGEFHTLVLKGPIFKGQIVLKETKQVPGTNYLDVISYEIN